MTGASMSSGFSFAALAFLPLLWLSYSVGAYRQRSRGYQWSRWRWLSFSVGCLLLMIAVLPPVMAHAHHDFRLHMLQHLLIGMVAPLGLVLAAPVTLLLRSLPVPAARRVTGFLHSFPIRLLSHPVVALLLNVGGMYLLYLTPLYKLSLTHGWLHYFIHVHFLLAGYLFTWSILAGPDAAPRSPTFGLRLAVLFVSIGAHANLSKWMYGYLWPKHTGHSAEQLQAGAQLMYYGGDFAEVLLAVALFSMWYQRGSFEPVLPQGPAKWRRS